MYHVNSDSPTRRHVCARATLIVQHPFRRGRLLNILEVQDALQKRQDKRNRQREAANAGIQRPSPGSRVKVGDWVMVKESDSTLNSQGTHPKLLHDHFTAPWRVIKVLIPGQSVEVVLNGRRLRRRVVSTSSLKPFYLREERLRHEFEDEFSHVAWGADLGLIDASVAATPLYTLLDRRAVSNPNDSWSWEYRSRFQDGTESGWVDEKEVKDSFTSLQLDVFHALWEAYHGPSLKRRPEEGPSKEDRDTLRREEALRKYPVGTHVRRAFADPAGRIVESDGVIYDFHDRYWRARHPDGDWEELNEREVVQGRKRAEQYQEEKTS